MIKPLLVAFAAILPATLTASVAVGQTADLTVRFEYSDAAPQRLPEDINKDAAFCGQHNLTDETLVVDEQTKGIKNVILYVYTGRGGTKLGRMPKSDNVHTLANEDCRFEPHITLAQAGDTLKITNPDPVAHNANLGFLNNKSANVTVPSGQEVTVSLKKDEPAPIPVACNIHPWMLGYVVVLDHPFAGVSDTQGSVTIKGLPANEDLTFRVFHESLKIREVSDKASGETTELKRALIELKLQPGMNDLGTWVVPAA